MCVAIRKIVQTFMAAKYRVKIHSDRRVGSTFGRRPPEKLVNAANPVEGETTVSTVSDSLFVFYTTVGLRRFSVT